MDHNRKRRLVTALEKHVQNPPIRLLLRVGFPIPILALLETTGRRTGKRRQLPVINGLTGHEFWLVAEHGRSAHYVRNLEANPEVRIKIGRRWHVGTATILPDDDPFERARWMRETLGPWHRLDLLAAKTFGTDPLSVRIDLNPADTIGTRT